MPRGTIATKGIYPQRQGTTDGGTYLNEVATTLVFDGWHGLSPSRVGHTTLNGQRLEVGRGVMW